MALSNVTALTAGAEHSCAIVSDGGVVCWGSNVEFRAGPSTATALACAHPVPLPARALKIAAGPSMTCAIVDLPRRVLCWGRVVGAGVSATPIPLPGLGNGTPDSISVGGAHACVYFSMRTSALGIECVGNSPLDVFDAGFTAGVYISLCSGRDHTCAVRNGGSLQCWGDNTQGQANPGSGATSIAIPEAVRTDAGTATEVFCGAQFSCARWFPNRVSCWGANHTKQLENSAVTTHVGPTMPFSAVTVGAGTGHLCVGLGGGNATNCRGQNMSGQARGEALPLVVPMLTPIVEALAAPDALAAGDSFTCALYDGGTVSCWGANAQVGNPLGDFAPIPVMMGQ